MSPVFSWNDILTYSGVIRRLQMRADDGWDLLKEQEKAPPRCPIKMKVFNSKHGAEKLEDYSQLPPPDFWNKVKQTTWKEVKEVKATIDGAKLVAWAGELGYPDLASLEKVRVDLKYGARLGVAEEFRIASTSTNATSALDHGEEVTDALLDWLQEGYCIGPFEPEEIPFEEIKVSGLMCKMKPNGKARIIVNLSKGRPVSVNEGIDKKQFPTAMSSTTAWIRILLRCGKNAKFCKCDWAAAYKQVSLDLHEEGGNNETFPQVRVHKDDVHLQGFAWLGKVFFEVCLVFGAVSSPGIYDRIAKVVVWIAAAQSGFPMRLLIQHLDDICACSQEGSDRVDKFYESYLRVCKVLNIKLADPTDPDKAFSPRTEGQVLGVDYCTVTMTWSLRQDKITSILDLCERVMEEGEATARELKSLCGKLVDIRNLIVGSKFYLAHIMRAANHFNDREDLEEMVEVGDWCRADLYYFSLVLPLYSGRSRLQDPDRKPDWWALESHTDAAGGSRESLGRGVGMTIFPHIWTIVPWGRRINEGWRSSEGKSLAHAMSAWELTGPLLTLVCGGNRLTGKQVKVYVDNDGSVVMWTKGWTTKCDLCNTLLLAMHQISCALSCELFVCGVTRCSDSKTEAADALSKFDMKRFRENMPEANTAPESVPGALLSWLENPVPDRMLGHRILKQMANYCTLVNYW